MTFEPGLKTRGQKGVLELVFSSPRVRDSVRGLWCRLVRSSENWQGRGQRGSTFLQISYRIRSLSVGAEGDPACIVVDEIDAVGKSRLKGNGVGGNDGREQRLNQLPAGLYGFNATRKVVVLVGVLRTRGGEKDGEGYPGDRFNERAA